LNASTSLRRSLGKKKSTWKKTKNGAMQNPKTPASSEDSSSKIHDVLLSLLCSYYYHPCQICTARCGNARGRDEAGGNFSRFFPYLEQPDIDSCLKYAALTRRIAKSGAQLKLIVEANLSPRLCGRLKSVVTKPNICWNSIF
jgi:hypothetical protein